MAEQRWVWLLVLLVVQPVPCYAETLADEGDEVIPEGLFEFLGESEEADEMWLDAQLWGDAMVEPSGGEGDE